MDEETARSEGLAKAGLFSPIVTAPQIGANFEQMKRVLDDALADYRGLDDEALARMDPKEIAACHKHVNAYITNFEDARKRVRAEYMRPYDEFKAKCDELLAEAREAKEKLAAAKKRNQEIRRELLVEGLRNTYLDAAGALAEVVPFERLLGMHPEWPNLDGKAGKHAEELVDALVGLNKDWKRLQGLEPSMPFYQEAEAEFFRTLDIGAALDLDKRRQEEQARIDAMKAEVEAYREEREAAARPEPEAEPPQEEETQPEQGRGVPEILEFVFTVQCTYAQRDEIVAFLKSIGVTGRAGKAER